MGRIGYAVFSISTNQGQTKVKLLDHEGIQQAARRAILALTVNVAEAVNADSLDTSDDTAARIDIGILRLFLLRRRKRRYLHSVSDEAREETGWMKRMHPDYCDGDTAFT